MITKKEVALDAQSFELVPELPFTINGLPRFKIVNFYGLPLAVPKGFKWIAFDTDGDIHAFKNKPTFNGRYFYFDNDLPDDESIQLADLTCYTFADFTPTLSKRSLIKVKKLPRYYP